jgi:hypothetical protein
LSRSSFALVPTSALGAVDEVELYRALDWLGACQGAIEAALARRHLKDGALVLYDVSSSWLEGRCCELARFGYSRSQASPLPRTRGRDQHAIWLYLRFTLSYRDVEESLAERGSPWR